MELTWVLVELSVRRRSCDRSSFANRSRALVRKTICWVKRTRCVSWMAIRRFRSAAVPFLVWTTSSTPPVVVRGFGGEWGFDDIFGDSVTRGELEDAPASFFREAREGSSEEGSERRVRRFLWDVLVPWAEDATVLDWIRLTRERSRVLGSSDDGDMLDPSNVFTEEISTQ